MGGRFIFGTCTGPLGKTEIRSHFQAKRIFDRTLIWFPVGWERSSLGQSILDFRFSILD
ncbi:hypothetical protein QUB56_30755 [Microcoleus sp. AR_TQ3_B6]|uniref:hypothetical protein n=1 Tax=Microcoleus sp. AR_TQ3_B6 TaxID=3055284 RepID=UPI002FD6D78B